MKTVRILGILLVLWAIIVQVHGLIDNWQDRNRTAAVVTGAGEHTGHDMSQMKGMPLEAPEPTWHMVWRGTLLAIIAGLALVPVAQGRAWAVWTMLALWLVYVVPRIVSDPRCWVAYDPTRHGCHLFMRSVILAAVGLVLCGIGSRNRPAAPTT